MYFTVQMPMETLVEFTGGFPQGYTGPGCGAFRNKTEQVITLSNCHIFYKLILCRYMSSGQ